MAGLGSALENVTGLVLWNVLPPMIARFLLRSYYRVSYGLAPLQPREGSAIHRRDYNRAYTLVAIVYFAYCIANFAYNVKEAYYDVVGVHREDIDTRLKTQFRHAIVHLHPDKNPDADPAKFLRMKQAYEILNTFETRCAYDCYGPDVIKTVQMSSTSASTATTIQDYFTQSFYDWVAFYAVTLVVFILSSLRTSWNRVYWRSIALFACASIDIYVLMRPLRFGYARPDEGALRIVFRYLNGMPTYIKLAFLRQIYIYGSMAGNQIASLYEQKSDSDQISERIKYIEQLSKTALTKETAFNLAHSLEPVRDNAEMRNQLRQQMGKLAAELQLFDMLDAGDRARINNIQKQH